MTLTFEFSTESPKSKLRPFKICYSGLEPEQIYIHCRLVHCQTSNTVNSKTFSMLSWSSGQALCSPGMLLGYPSCCTIAGHATWLSKLLVRLSVQVNIEISKIGGCFALFCTISDPRCANLRRASQGAPCNALKLGIYSRISLNLCQQSPPSDSLNQGKSTAKLF